MGRKKVRTGKKALKSKGKRKLKQRIEVWIWQSKEMDW